MVHHTESLALYSRPKRPLRIRVWYAGLTHGQRVQLAIGILNILGASLLLLKAGPQELIFVLFAATLAALSYPLFLMLYKRR